MNYKPMLIILLLISLLGLAGVIIMTGIAPAGGINIPGTEKQMTEDIPSANADPGTDTMRTQVLTEAQGAGLKFSGEVLTCTNKTDIGQVIDLKLSNLDLDDLSINIYPLNSTIELLPGQIIRKDLNLPSGISSLRLVSDKGEELMLQVPPCVSRGGSSSYDGSQSSLSSSTDQFERPPAPVPELSTIALTGFGIVSMILIMGRSKQ
ncbi:MAG: hypothetical protein J5U19_08400 [Candidatus Methanoperedens sp.]|nr:hypothetical protein [Candidatus Methanoperedens sp.]